MTLKFIDLYNETASQDWSMYDGDAVSESDFEQPLVISINKAVNEIMYSYPFNFRERTHVLVTIPKVNEYSMPAGIIMKDKSENEYNIRINSVSLKRLDNTNEIKTNLGIPDSFYIRGEKIILSPTPAEKVIVTIDYITLAVAENRLGEEIFNLKNKDDTILVPEYLEEIFKQAVISRTMLNSIASENDENFSAYKKQSETYYRQLIKYSKGVGLDKSIKI